MNLGVVRSGASVHTTTEVTSKTTLLKITIDAHHMQYKKAIINLLMASGWVGSYPCLRFEILPQFLLSLLPPLPLIIISPVTNITASCDVMWTCVMAGLIHAHINTYVYTIVTSAGAFSKASIHTHPSLCIVVCAYICPSCVMYFRFMLLH